jgi:hypothetical protein
MKLAGDASAAVGTLHGKLDDCERAMAPFAGDVAKVRECTSPPLGVGAEILAEYEGD